MSEQIQDRAMTASNGHAQFDPAPAGPQVRNLDVIEMEIRVLQDQAQRVVLGYAIETGRRLEEAKAMLEHGQWGGWLRKMGYSQSTANNLMRVFREYGASQQSLFGGEANSQALGNLTYTKALQLLALPDQEAREAFVAEHDVEHMSTRELEQALKDRAEAMAAAETARAEAVAEMQARVDKAKAARDKAEEKRKEAEAALEDVKAKLEAAGKADRKAAIAGDSDLAVFEMLFGQAQEIANKLLGLLLKARGREDGSQAAGMRKSLVKLSEAIGKAAEV